MERLTPKNFQETIDQDSYSLVIFGSLDCAPCGILKDTLAVMAPKYPWLKMYDYQARQLGSTEITTKYRVYVMPRSVFFKNGKEVGRFILAPSEAELAAKFKELEDTGRVLTEDGDVDEMVFLANKIQDVTGFKYSDFPQEEWEAKGDMIYSAAQSVFKVEQYPFDLPNEELAKLAKTFMNGDKDGK